MIRDDLGRRLDLWMRETADPATPPALLEAIVATTGARRPRATWLVAIRGSRMGKLGARPVVSRRRLVQLAVVVAVGLALVAGLLLAGAGRQPGPGSAIVFVRTDAARSADSPFIIGPDGSLEHSLTGGLGIPSPDGKRLLLEERVDDPAPLPDAETSWIRPVIANADGSKPTLLDAYPGRRMHLAPVAWSPDGSRILVSSGGEDVAPGDVGIYTIRTTDGGDLQRLVRTPAGNGDVVIGYSPDGTRILFSRVGDAPAIYTVASDGSDLARLSPASMVPVDLDFFDAVSVDWSPDGSQVVFAAMVGGTLAPGMYVVQARGGALTELVPPALGALSAQWSPKRAAIAFTSGHLGTGRTPAGKELTDSPQVWVVNADGTGRTRLTDGSDGSTSVAPVWSPDGSRLLFQRKFGDEVTLWTIDADGTDARRLTIEPVAADYVGRYAWTTLPAP
jgi:Tol biopolymer transport system component